MFLFIYYIHRIKFKVSFFSICSTHISVDFHIILLILIICCICALLCVLFIPGIFLVTDDDDVLERVFGLQKWGCFVIMLYKVL
jgi:hypothetical protein